MNTRNIAIGVGAAAAAALGLGAFVILGQENAAADTEPKTAAAEIAPVADEGDAVAIDAEIIDAIAYDASASVKPAETNAASLAPVASPEVVASADATKIEFDAKADDAAPAADEAPQKPKKKGWFW